MKLFQNIDEIFCSLCKSQDRYGLVIKLKLDGVIGSYDTFKTVPFLSPAQVSQLLIDSVLYIMFESKTEYEDNVLRISKSPKINIFKVSNDGEIKSLEMSRHGGYREFTKEEKETVFNKECPFCGSSLMDDGQSKTSRGKVEKRFCVHCPARFNIINDSDIESI